MFCKELESWIDMWIIIVVKAIGTMKLLSQMSSILHVILDVIGFAIEEFTLCNEICFESSIYLFIFIKMINM